MQLTQEEQATLDGRYGEPSRWAMDLLVKQGEYYDAKDLAPIGSAHITCDIVVYRDWGIRFVERLAEQGARFRVPTTMDVTAVDYERWAEMGVEHELAEKQARFTATLVRMGGIACHSDAVFQVGNVPRLGEHLAWTSTSNTVMANAYFGARTNLEGYSGALAAAIAGRAPRCGLHLDGPRRGNVVVRVEAHLDQLSDWEALGFHVGRELRRYDLVPVFEGLPADVTVDHLKRLGASLVYGPGNLAMFHAVGTTPEAPTRAAALGRRKPVAELTVSQQDIRAAYGTFSGSGPVDMVWFGCPGLSINEIRSIAALFAGRRVKSGVEVWLFTPEATRAVASRMGLTRVLEEAGCKVLANACGMIVPGEGFRQKIAGRALVSDSLKHVYTYAYAATFVGEMAVRAIWAPTDACVRAAIDGCIS